MAMAEIPLAEEVKEVVWPDPVRLIKIQTRARTPSIRTIQGQQVIYYPPKPILWIPSTIDDTSAPTCISRREYMSLRRMASICSNWEVNNPATGLPDHMFKASFINRSHDDPEEEEAAAYSSETPVAASVNAHEVLPGASVLKRFREKLGGLGERASVLKRSREEFGESSESASVLKRLRKGA